MIRPITTRGNPVLATEAALVDISTIGSKELNGVIQDMKDTLRNCEDGLAIAAPQIGESLSIFVVSGRFFPPRSGDEGDEELPPGPDLVFINPKITKRSAKKLLLEEGCLSVRWLYGDIERNDKVTLEALDENGKKVVRGASGLLAQVFQHETDHLKGILFIDSAENIREVLPESEEHKEYKKSHAKGSTHKRKAPSSGAVTHTHSHDHDHDHHGHDHTHDH